MNIAEIVATSHSGKAMAPVVPAAQLAMSSGSTLLSDICMYQWWEG